MRKLVLHNIRRFSKNGSYIAEAAVVLPIIIFAIITTVLIAMFFYEQSVEESRMHIALRCRAGQITEKTIFYTEGAPAEPANIWDGDISVSSRGVYKDVIGQGNVSMVHNGLIRGFISNEIQGEWAAIDPVKIRRMK